MKGDKICDLLRNRYSVDEKTLVNLGLIKEETELVPARISKMEHRCLKQLALKNDTKMSVLVRNKIKEILFDKGKIVLYLSIEAPVVNGSESSTFNILLSKEDAQEFKKICSGYDKAVQKIIRQIIIYLIGE